MSLHAYSKPDKSGMKVKINNISFVLKVQISSFNYNELVLTLINFKNMNTTLKTPELSLGGQEVILFPKMVYCFSCNRWKVKVYI